MTHYLAQLRTTAGALPWEYRFEISSDKMAIDHTARHATAFAHCSWFYSILLWRMPDQKLVAEISLAPARAKVDDQGIEGAI